ncbi:MAG: hypothetical protein K6U14_05255 [Firmicutes bacterium]|nr:hypothetical protein [Alicyclobacillaceae bacterium]MCL6497026.1 hypothetical protein [Bacillota bacterium]
MLYHLAWLAYDLTHWRGPWTLFWIAMGVWALIRGLWGAYRKGRRRS